jgi:hypothetical protein
MIVEICSIKNIDIALSDGSVVRVCNDELKPVAVGSKLFWLISLVDRDLLIPVFRKNEPIADYKGI